MAKVVKMCDMNANIAAKVFEMLNYGHVKIVGVRGSINLHGCIQSDIEPKLLTYPEGWYYAKGCFRNKHMSTTGVYQEVRMIKPDGSDWKDTANYCTLN